MPLRHPVCGRITYPLGLNPAGVSLFRTHAAQSSLRTDCGTFWHAFALLLKASRAGVSLFRMHDAQSPWRTDCGTFCRTEPFADRLWHILARFCFAFSGFEDAASAPSLRTNYLPLGLESCWGFPVSHACRTEPFADRLWHILARFCFAFGGFEDAASAPMPLGSRAPGRFSFHVARASLHDPFGFLDTFSH